MDGPQYVHFKFVHTGIHVIMHTCMYTPLPLSFVCTNTNALSSCIDTERVFQSCTYMYVY